ncbi:UNVERIFIED_CONTAM: hypothetical protein PYX00_006346 [Menopon gallinae]|uniref:Sodium-coupled monocarboxylate transporter 1 n=1 Tax=Menopon gallinae TaxID=328185 RepID=A0AAW2HVU0_9NEOP
MAKAMENGSRVFGWEDYTVFAAMLVVSALIGLYHGCRFGLKRKKKKDEPESGSPSDFLTGGGQMSVIPVALSMLASFLSSITLMGQPVEVYLYGPQMWLMGLASFVVVPVIGYIFVPFFRKMKVTSAYEYYGKRFNRKFQLFASSIFTVQMLLYLALVLYAPALALHQVTGINTEVVVVVMYVVCIFYTTVGGIKAVVWTDSFQIIVMYTAIVAVLIKGTFDVGGLDVVWSRNKDASRDVLFDFDFDPTRRYTFWSVFIGSAFLHFSVFGSNQLQIQRYLSVQSISAARKMLWINAFGWALVSVLTAYTGMLIFAKYFDCDPITNKDIKSPDQLFPLYVMDVLGEYKGFPGLFVAGIFSAGLSTVSTGMNSLAAIWYAELEGTQFKSNLSSKKAGLTVKALALIFGLSSFAMVFLVPFMGPLVAIAISLSGFFSGSLLGVFLLGIYVPFANAMGAFVGLVSGIGIVGWMTIGVQVSIEKGYYVYETLPLSTAGCPVANETFSALIQSSDQELALLPYRISFLWYSFLAILITFVVGVVVSLLSRLICSSSPHTVLFKPTQGYQGTAYAIGKENKSNVKCDSATIGVWVSEKL